MAGGVYTIDAFDLGAGGGKLAEFRGTVKGTVALHRLVDLGVMSRGGWSKLLLRRFNFFLLILLVLLASGALTSMVVVLRPWI